MSDSPSLDQLDALASAATPGPWTALVIALPMPRLGTTVTNASVEAPAPTGQVHTVAMCGRAEADAHFIAACSPEVIRALLARLRVAERKVTELRAAIAIATHEAVAPLYFADNSDYAAGLYDVVKVLDPALWMQLEDGVTGAHYQHTLAAAEAHRLAVDLAAAPSPTGSEQ